MPAARIAFYNGALYAEVNDRIVRYALLRERHADRAPRGVVSGLPSRAIIPMHPFAIDAQGGLYVDLGSATNQPVQNRMLNSRHQSMHELSSAPAFGAMTQIGQGSSSRPPSAATGPATARASRSDSRAESTRPSTAGSVGGVAAALQAGAGATAAEGLVRWSVVPARLAGVLLDDRATETRAGPEYGGDGGNAVGHARRSKLRSRPSSRTGRPTISCSTTDINFRPPRVVCSLHFTAQEPRAISQGG